MSGVFLGNKKGRHRLSRTTKNMKKSTLLGLTASAAFALSSQAVLLGLGGLALMFRRR